MKLKGDRNLEYGVGTKPYNVQDTRRLVYNRLSIN